MSKIKCFNCGEYGHFAQDCLKAHDDANIAQESEQNKKVENMLDLDNISISEECAMMCTEVIGCDLQTQGWIHSKRNLACVNCPTTKP